MLSKKKLYYCLYTIIAIFSSFIMFKTYDGQPPWEIRQMVLMNFIAVGVWLIATIITFAKDDQH